MKKVVFEIELDDNTPLEAAKTAERWIKEDGSHFTYTVQDEDGNIFSVDLDECDEDAVLPADDYQPLIKK